MGSHIQRLDRAAKREGVSPQELDDAVQLLASRFPLTAAEVLAVVEGHGLAEAEAQIRASL